jgi:hypothetical protein
MGALEKGRVIGQLNRPRDGRVRRGGWTGGRGWRMNVVEAKVEALSGAGAPASRWRAAGKVVRSWPSPPISPNQGLGGPSSGGWLPTAGALEQQILSDWAVLGDGTSATGVAVPAHRDGGWHPFAGSFQPERHQLAGKYALTGRTLQGSGTGQRQRQQPQGPRLRDADPPARHLSSHAHLSRHGRG